MGPIEQLKTDMLQALQGQLTGCTLTGEFPDRFVSPDPQALMVVLGVRSLHLKEGALGGYWGEPEGENMALTHGRLADVTLEFTLLHPNRTGQALQQAGDRLMDLLLTSSPYPITQLNQETMTFDRTMGCIRMSITARLELLFSGQEHQVALEEIQLVWADAPASNATGKERGS